MNGQIGGIVIPNDGKCHLDNQGNYTLPLQQDYPSLGQLSRLAKDSSINLVFAVTNPVSYSYAVLSNSIKGSSVGILANDSSNIVELVKQQYNTISSSVQLKAATTAAVGVRFFTSCNGATVQESDKCANLVDGRPTSFIVNIEVRPQTEQFDNQFICCLL
jgi:integrin beta 1